MKLLDSLKRIYTKYNCKQKHFLWFLSLSTPCMSHFHSNNQFPRISNLIPCIPTAIPQIPTLIPCISHIPKLIPPISPPPYSWHSQPDCLHPYPIPPTLLIPFPNFPIRVWKHLQPAEEVAIKVFRKENSSLE